MHAQITEDTAMPLLSASKKVLLPGGVLVMELHSERDQNLMIESLNGERVLVYSEQESLLDMRAKVPTLATLGLILACRRYESHYKVWLEGLGRVFCKGLIREFPFCLVHVGPNEMQSKEDNELLKTSKKQLIHELRHKRQYDFSITKELLAFLVECNDHETIIDMVAFCTLSDYQEQQTLLFTQNLSEAYRFLIRTLKKQTLQLLLEEKHLSQLEDSDSYLN